MGYLANGRETNVDIPIPLKELFNLESFSNLESSLLAQEDF